MGFSAKLVGTALGWLKAIANDVLRLFNLTGAGAQPLVWLADHWRGLLVILMIFGITADIVVWIFRWRPHWAWFRLKRIVVNDASLVSESDTREERLMDGESDAGKRYVVPKDDVYTHAASRKNRRRRTGETSATPRADDQENLFEVGTGEVAAPREDRVFEVDDLTKNRT